MKDFSKQNGSGPGRRLRWAIPGAVILALLYCCAAEAGQTVTLAWNAPASGGAAGYYLYSGTNSGVYTSQFDTGTNTMITLSGLCEGHTNYFMVVAYNSARIMGTPSAQLSFIVPGCLRLAPATKASNPANISFPVAVGHSYEVQASTNLQSWTNLWQTSVSTSNAWVSWQDTQAGGFPHRFYRLLIN
jgi:hypothetical protein